MYLLTSWCNTLKKRYPAIADCATVKEINSLVDVLAEVRLIADGCTRHAVFLDTIDAAFLMFSLDEVLALLKKISSQFLLSSFS